MKKNGKYLIVDTEATGLDIYKHSLIQLAAAVLDENLEILETFCVDVRPKDENFEYTKEALEVNNFTLERIKSGVEVKKACDQFVSFCQKYFDEENKPVYIGQFYPFDFALINKFFGEAGLGLEWLKITGNEFIDTKVLVLAANLQAQKNGRQTPFEVTSLSKPGGLSEKFKIEGHKAHDALGDVLMTREVLVRLFDYLDIVPNLDN